MAGTSLPAAPSAAERQSAPKAWVRAVRDWPQIARELSESTRQRKRQKESFYAN
jgi:hypothetical protein